MPLQLNQLDLDRLTMELGRHVRCRCPLIDVPSQTAKEWLDRTTRELPRLGHWRFATGRDGMELLCEFSRDSRLGGDPIANARDVFFACLESLSQFAECDASVSAAPAFADDLETELEATGLSWSRRDAIWSLNPAPEIALTVEAVPGGVLVCGDLAVWEALPDDTAEALGVFLNDAQSRISGARCQWRGAAASATSFVLSQQLECEFATSVRSVFDAVRRFGRSAQALLEPSLAQHYLKFCLSSPILVEAANLCL